MGQGTMHSISSGDVFLYSHNETGVFEIWLRYDYRTANLLRMHYAGSNAKFSKRTLSRKLKDIPFI